MKILSIQGHFGNLCGTRIEFGEGFTGRVLPNGWGKTTLCAFLRVMLYGLSTARRDTQTALSDKTRYAPRDGHAMSGRLTVRHEGRVIVISRSAGRGGAMQEFDAFYEDTGEKCAFLNAKNCGHVLLGMGEDAFLSSAFIDGAVLQRPSDELRERMLEMAQSGDTQGRATDALRTLDRWRLDLDSGNGHGELPRLRARMDEIDGALMQLVEAEEEIARQRARAEALAGAEDAAREEYERAYRAYAAETTGGGERLGALIDESTRLVRELDARVPAEDTLRTAAEALYGYEGALKLEREKRERLPGGHARYEQALEALAEEQRLDEIARNEAGKPHVRWFPLALAFVFACASAATNLLDVTWGPFTPYAPFALPVFAVIGLVAAFAGCVRKETLPPPRDFRDERETLLRELRHTGSEQDTASQVLQDAFDTLMQAARKLSPTVSTIEEAADAVRRAQDESQTLRREQAALQELLLQRTKLPEGGETRLCDVEQLREALAQARARASDAAQALAQLEGRAQAQGGVEQLTAERKALAAQLAEGERRHAAICEAAEQTRAAQAALSARVSPQITEKAREYLEFLTEGAWREVRLDAALSARCAGEDGQLLDALRLSAGTRDQLYLALRLAVSEVLAGEGEPCPLVLDDPFLTFDDARTARGMELLRRIAKRRQVILLTCRAAPRT